MFKRQLKWIKQSIMYIVQWLDIFILPLIILQQIAKSLIKISLAFLIYDLGNKWTMNMPWPQEPNKQHYIIETTCHMFDNLLPIIKFQ